MIHKAMITMMKISEDASSDSRKKRVYVRACVSARAHEQELVQGYTHPIAHTLRSIDKHCEVSFPNVIR